MSKSTNTMLSLLVLLTICIGAFFISVSYQLHWIIIFGLFILAACPYLYSITAGEHDPFEPVLWFAPVFVIVYAVGAARRLINDDFIFQADFVVNDPIVAILELLLLATVGLVALLFGYYRPWGQVLATRLPKFNTAWSSRRAWVMIVITTTLGLYGFWLLMPSLGVGPRSHLAKGSSRVAFVLVNLLIVSSILLISDTLISAVAYEDWSIEVHQPWKLVVAIPFVLCNVRLLWLLGGRGRALNIFVVSVFLFHYIVRRFSLWEGLVTFVGVKIIPAWAAAIVTSIISLNISDLIYHLQNPFLFRESPTRPFNNVVVVISGVPETQGFTYGETFLSAFFEVIPHQPFRETTTVYNMAFYPSIAGDFGVPITMLGELYLNFWIPGVILGLLVAGIVIRTSYEWLIVQGGGYASIVIFAAITNDFLLMGNFSNSLPGTGIVLLPLCLCVYFISFNLSREPV